MLEALCYTNLNTFNGWSDGVTELSRTEKLTGDLNLTAKFTDNRDVVSAFTLNGIISPLVLVGVILGVVL